MKPFAIALVFALLLGCPGVTDTKPGKAVIDCLKADKETLISTSSELRPLVFGDKPDWSTLYEKAKHAGKVIGGCVLADLVQEYLSSKKALPTDASWGARGVLEEFRNNEAGGATFHTKAGDL